MEKDIIIMVALSITVIIIAYFMLKLMKKYKEWARRFIEWLKNQI